MIPAPRSILLGRSLDDLPYPSQGEVSEISMGPRAFLDFLETHLGFLPGDSSFMERLASFMAIIRDHEELIPSFAASWKNAPFATARTLLSWLDTWREHGWRGPEDAVADSDLPPKVAELTALARAASGKVPPGTGERLQKTAEALRSGLRVPLGSLNLVEDGGDWPAAWGEIFSLLPAVHREPPLELRARVSVISCDSALAGARAAADLLASLEGSVRLIVEGGGALLDGALAGASLPRLGLSSSRSPAAAVQILPLALALQKSPVSLAEILSFLDHPLCPLGKARHELGETAAATGGIRNEEWQKVLSNSGEEEKLVEQTALWIPPEENRVTDGLTRKRALEIAGKIARHLASRNDDACRAAAGAAAVFMHSLELLGPRYDFLPWTLVSDLLSEIPRSDGGFPFCAEEGFIPAAPRAGALTEKVDHLMWFLPAESPPVQSWPWSRAERAALARSRCILPDGVSLRARELREVMRVCALPGSTLTLIRNTLRPAGAGMSLAEGYLLPRVDPADPASNSDEEPHTSIPVPHRPLPSLKPRWQLPLSAAPGKGWRTSYSQITVLIERPAQWVLRYPAQLRSGSLLSAPDQALLRGTCAHRVTERLFTDFKDRALTLSEKEFAPWFERVFMETLEGYGYAFLEGGAARVRTQFKETLRASLRELAARLSAAGARNIALERHVTGTLFDAELGGFADLVFTTPKGGGALIDMKYSFSKDAYRDRIAEDRDIQLTLYAELLRQETALPWESAYWLFPKEALLARNDAVFPGAIGVHSPASLEERLEMIGASLAWRKGELGKGDVEVVCEDTGRAEEPAGTVPLGDIQDGYDPYLSLYGWKEQA